MVCCRISSYITIVSDGVINKKKKILLLWPHTHLTLQVPGKQEEGRSGLTPPQT